ncbi:MSMEG_1061 family FMN-dependent PPOX-type flavoprotein [Microbacterium fluvii]|uniref:MSMEG_1061 family FMN-dependent PPOX-type flavoprotein n=1 Tax=Microbacterium fluvii TaxID=415215 RepID=A0ABW2HHC1_9MICO|nr:MSMEG_1061 family FMN-dependent PPOX-type flavoprotein [Microbacterium fluvii]MCU4672764.1 pyridoxamine 5'-phosphate oxidase family protein [Microbacterium fluvii]
MLSTDFRALGLDDVRSTLGDPTDAAIQKITDHLDDNCLTFLAHSPFCTLATSDAQGNCDSSPRGDYPGFIRPLDERTLAIPDRLGNKIADSMRNIIDNGHVGLLCFVPGMTETLRINGTAFITDDPTLRSMLEQDHVQPDLAIVIRTEQVYLHCGRALLRAGLWDPEMQDLAAEVPSSGQIWASMSGWDSSVGDVIDGAMVDAYRALY